MNVTAKKFLALVFLSFAGATNAAESSTKTYFDLSYGQLTYKESGLSSLSPSIISGTFGSYVYDGLAFEGFLATGVSDDSVTYSGVPLTLKVDSAVGFYVKPYLRVSEGTEVYAKVGYFRGRLTVSAPRGLSDSTTGSDVSYGVGLSTRVGGSVSVFAEYMSYYDKSDTTIRGLNLGVKIPF
ncbi:outer membrane beta-barrel protein [Betaproteobacteria bacterium LSUCC0115]|nr:outer membrane beta-barrel protein [Burkholderiales bacterium LSUCC0115]